MILLTGGARSGKSALAEQLIRERGDRVLYIATAVVTDPEMAERIARHRQQRPDGWDTYEGSTDLGQIIRERGAQYDAILLECITTLVTNLMFAGMTPDDPAALPDFVEAEHRIDQQIDALIAGCQACPAPVYVVTNEVGLGIVPDNALARQFRDIAGRVNQRLAAAADQVYLVVSGLPLCLKDSQPRPVSATASKGIPSA
jgi:adenosylcobinamide kinase/adenosylcobinamide-phosphate guanylyltransferase